jgi:hypothetical protein
MIKSNAIKVYYQLEIGMSSFLLRKIHLYLEKGITNGYTKLTLYFNLSEPPKGDNRHEFRKEKNVFRNLHLIGYRFPYLAFRMLQRVKD